MPFTQSSPRLRLVDHVRACVVGDQMIFLDLQRSKYVGVGGPHVPALSAAILGGAPVEHALALSPNSELPEHCVRRLRSQQLLSDAARRPTDVQPTLQEPVAGMDTDDVRSNGQDWRNLLRLWRSTLIASAWLRMRTLADIADRIAGLRSLNSNRGITHDAEAVRVAVATYLRLRPFALTTHDRCLNDSLTLLHFLASYGLFPQWVIGVRVNPFGAHSWIQSGGIVLNDVPERVRRYQPILVV